MTTTEQSICARWWRLRFEKFGHDGARAVMTEIESPEEIGAFNLVVASHDEALPRREPAEYVPLNAGGMARRAYAIATAELNAEEGIRAVFGQAQWFRATVRGTYWENGRECGVDRTVYLAQRVIA